jgi:hypothetical protein
MSPADLGGRETLRLVSRRREPGVRQGMIFQKHAQHLSTASLRGWLGTCLGNKCVAIKNTTGGDVDE